MNAASAAATTPPQVSVVVPVYREERNIRPFVSRMTAALAAAGLTYEIIFCLDPSPDGSERAIMEEIERDPNVRLLVFSRRFGQPAATWAGILATRGESCLVIDVDLQDPPELVGELHRKLAEGHEVVFAKRRSRRGETLLKRVVSSVGYRLIRRLSDVEIPEDTGDFRLMSRRVVEELRRLSETHGFLRGLVAYVGFRQTFVWYDRDERRQGSGKYNRFTGSLKIGLNGIVSFSTRPLQIMTVVGVGLSLFSFLLGAKYLFQKLTGTALTPGLPTTVLVVTFFSGVQLLSLGLIGEYVGRIYEEVKRRPMYIVDRKVNF